MKIKKQVWMLGGAGLLAVAAVVLAIALRPASEPESAIQPEPQLAAVPEEPPAEPEKPEAPKPAETKAPAEKKEPAKTEETPAVASTSPQSKQMLSDPIKGIWNDDDFDPYTGEFIKEWPSDNESVLAIFDETDFRRALIEGNQEDIDYFVKELGKEIPDNYQSPEQPQGMDPHNPAQEAPPPSYQAPDGSGAYDNPNPPAQSGTGEMDPVAAAEGIVVGTEGWSQGQSEADKKAHESLAGLEWG